MKTRPWLEGSGLAMLYLLPPLGQFLSPDRRIFYHQILPVTTLTRGILIDLLLLGLLGGIGFTLLDRATPRLRQILWLPVFFALAWIAARDISTTISNPMTRGHLLRFAPYIPGVVLVAFVLLLLWKPRIYSYCVSTVAVIFAAGGIAVLVVILPRLLMEAFSRLPHEQASFNRPVSNPWHPGQLRVVWILFDELSYRQTFEHRQPGIDLPAFTRFADESITFSQLSPVGYETERILPSLISGQPVTDVKGDAKGRMLLQPTPDAPWLTLTRTRRSLPRPDVRDGAPAWLAGTTPIAAFSIPSWTAAIGPLVSRSQGRLFSRLSSRQSSWRNALDGLPLAARFEGRWNRTPQNQALHQDYRNILHAGEALIQDSDIRLAFIHMPVPHPPGLFKNPNVSGNDAFDYLGNLMLADQAMAQFLNSVAQSPATADTVLIVSSDHSWRVPLWRGVPGWTRAEERATNGGVFDPRPVLMVRFPRQAGAQQIDRHESEMIVHGLVLDLISGKVRTPEDWIASLPSSAPATVQEDTAKKK